jgi:hypothetical protein
VAKAKIKKAKSIKIDQRHEFNDALCVSRATPRYQGNKKWTREKRPETYSFPFVSLDRSMRVGSVFFEIQMNDAL